MALGGFARTGAWVDEIVITLQPSLGAGVAMLKAGDLDLWAHAGADRAVFTEVLADPALKAWTYVGLYYDLTMNHGRDMPLTTAGRLNPFGVVRIREAMNWVIDRYHLAIEVMGGLGTPKFTFLTPEFPDGKTRYPHILAAIEDFYAYDFAKGEAIITEEMTKLGATKVGGIWHHQGQPVELRFLIRSDDIRRQMGDYMADQLERLGFPVIRQYGTGGELAPIWQRTEPREGAWHLVTGGWSSPAVSRDQGAIFNQMHTTRVMPVPLWSTLQTAVTMPELDAVADRLARRDFASMEEREVLFEQVMWLSSRYANQIALADRLSFSPARSNVAAIADASAGIVGSTAWAHGIQFQRDGKPVPGGRMRIAVGNMLIDAWNPVAGSNWVFDWFVVRATGEDSVIIDPFDGLVWPLHFERAEVQVLRGLPVEHDPRHDWVTLEFVDQIPVPADAWSDWDPVAQRFITVGERFPEGVTARRMSRVYYPATLFNVPLHDGSKISIADFVLGMILTFDRGKPESAIFDEAEVAALRSLLLDFRGVRIVSQNPLVIETYSNVFFLDAELNVSDWFPMYARGPGFWHTVALGIMAETNKELAFSATKADALKVPWMDYTKGESLPILRKYLDEAIATNHIPYAPTLAAFLPAAEVRARYANLKAWYERVEHFWVASGPYYLADVFPVEKIIVLRRFEQYPFDLSKWQFLVR
jgi:peptide/nickel transport system substrate-binding protein